MHVSHRSLSFKMGQKDWNKNVEPSINSLAVSMELHRARCLPKQTAYKCHISFSLSSLCFKLNLYGIQLNPSVMLLIFFLMRWLGNF